MVQSPIFRCHQSFFSPSPVKRICRVQHTHTRTHLQHTIDFTIMLQRRTQFACGRVISRLSCQHIFIHKLELSDSYTIPRPGRSSRERAARATAAVCHTRPSSAHTINPSRAPATMRAGLQATAARLGRAALEGRRCRCRHRQRCGRTVIVFTSGDADGDGVGGVVFR